MNFKKIVETSFKNVRERATAKNYCPDRLLLLVKQSGKTL